MHQKKTPLKSKTPKNGISDWIHCTYAYKNLKTNNSKLKIEFISPTQNPHS